MPINYGPDPAPEGVDLEGRPYWSNGEAPGNVREKRRVTLAMLNVLAHILYEGGVTKPSAQGWGARCTTPAWSGSLSR
jgi:hypothetical protein